MNQLASARTGVPVKEVTHGKAVLWLLLGTLFLSGTPLWVKASNMDPATQAFLRVILGFLILLPLGLHEIRRKGGLHRQGIILAAISGIFLGIDFVAWNYSIFLIGSGVAAILLNLQVVIVPMLTALIDKVKLPKSFVFILPIMIVGVLFTGGVFEPAEGAAGPAMIGGIKTSVIGTAAGLTSGLCYSLYLYLSRKASTSAPRKDLYIQPMMYTMLAQAVAPVIWMFTGGNGFNITRGVLTQDPTTGEMVLPTTLGANPSLREATMAGDPINFGNWVALALLIVLGQAAAWTLVQYGSVWLHPTLSAGILLLSPVTSVIIAGPLFAEWPSWLQWVGVALILACVGWQNGLIQAGVGALTGKRRAGSAELGADAAAVPRERQGARSRAVFALLGAAAVLLGIAAAAHNFVTGQIGWNTAFTIAQTVVAAALMVIVIQDGQGGGERS
ncbi:EamA family transporter [Propioniciclava sp. MC1595]|uniref:DMT family transporter n=1 Tax=Propioniciclava sp. MC1595 TaxID=2760308 RepID=UPI0016625469|nr:DMT family transporter [Propioniciclava sp. MC1595]MBB1495674.1 EamA family transporter [Propioniciclava sp. MC1595]QTE26097.1 EamA family transporter [Propioniciclava sp. MC1595]